MKVMEVTINDQGDGLYMDRLLFYLQDQLPFQITSLQPLRNHVFLLESKDFTKYIVKGYPSYRRLRTQVNITMDLKKHGFPHTYSFYNLTNGSPLLFEQTFYGIIEYLPPSAHSFTYEGHDNRVEALALLHQFHEVGRVLVEKYNGRLKKQHLLNKWRERTIAFLNQISFIKFFVQKEIIEEILQWADWSFRGLEQEDGAIDCPTVLHGDLAHHNFLRIEGEELYLIDFDLITIGDRSLDYLQFANRILPHIDWSLERLVKLELIRPFLHSKFFLYGLAFPSDIFREWNRLIREKHYNNPIIVRQVLDLTVGQFFERERFIKELKLALSELSQK
ncbi:phosphotransferase [Robertmurraya sp. FSL W8-0741]|uniref:phosphotransferase n=1 Tax=Robertmurraya sp. FSL W8-0741 TaxID=2954629 RepID=UPI00269FDA3D